jgi:hypothetical protein
MKKSVFVNSENSETDVARIGTDMYGSVLTDVNANVAKQIS